MKYSYISKIAGTGIIAASLAVVPLIPAQAQSNTAPDTSNTATDQDVSQSTGDRDFDWGWLGLLGLAGLAGLSRQRQETVDYTEPNEISTPVTTEKTLSYRETDIDSPVSTEKTLRYRDPNEINNSISTEKTLRYKDPNEMKLSDTDGTRKK